MEGYTLKQLKGFKFEVINDIFDKAFKRVNTFVDYKTELVEGSEKRAEDSTKRAGTELEQEVAKKQKIDDAKVDDDQEEAKMKELMNIIPGEEEVAIDAIPLATKPPCIVDWKIIKEGKISQFQIIRADGSSKRYSAFIHMLRNFDREDLETLWKLSTLSDVAIYAYLYAGREKGMIVVIKSFIRLYGIIAALIKVSVAQEESNESSAMIQNKVPPKLEDPRSFLIPCNFNKTFSCNALADLGASINLMPYSLYAKLSLETLKPTKMSVRLAYRSFQYPVGIAENMLIEVGKFTFPADFVILKMEEDNKVPLILGRPFLHTVDAVIRVKQKQLTLGVGTE
ncbi:reverse transcriptase domain-containing protein [Tanacetum coccineum]